MTSTPSEQLPQPVGIVPHTHWDREWYAPFQTYRARLVHLVDDLLVLLESDPRFTRFLLDGQTAVVDDYLEVRPEADGTLRALAAAGRVQVGPWMILMDEFMVSGETIVRNLQLGLRRAADLGGPAALRVGYLPDMFGHVAQMPQLLVQAGLHHAVVWRGVPHAIDRTAFDWYAPDGSTVRAEYLYGSYSNGRDLPRDPDGLLARARGYRAELGDAQLPGGGMLLMNGSDHLLPQPWLGEVVDAANSRQDEFRFAVTSLGEYVGAQPTEGLPAWHGELRSGARANLLMGVASNRVDVHMACAAAERALERVAEPLAALYLGPGDAHERLFGVAWRQLVLNSAHDSSCACSADEVVEAVRVRYQEARHIAEAVTRDALHALAATIDAPAGSTVVVNSVASERGGVVQVPVPGTGPVHFVALNGGARPSQVVATRAGEGVSTIVVGQKVRWVLEMMRGPEFASARVHRVERVELADGTVEFTFHDAAPGEDVIDLEPVKEELLALGERGATISIRQRRAPVREVLVAADAVPGFGWSTYRAVEGEGPRTAVRAEGLVLANEHVRVEIHPSDGALTVEADGVRITGADRLVDGGDGGDTYNYSPPDLDTSVDRPVAVSVEVVEAGPVRARLAVTRTYEWPRAAEGDERSCRVRTAETVAVDVRTIYELRTGERFVRVEATFDNRARDHRLRAHFPLPRPVTASHAECAFAVVERGLHAEGGPHEFGLPTYVSRRFVDCSDGEAGLALLHDGLLEYEVVDHGNEVALTLLRATGFLSRSELSLRPNPAGPLDPLEGPQLQGRLTVRYALLPHRGTWFDARLHDAADEFLVPLQRASGGAWPGADQPARGSHLTVAGAPVSAVTRDGDHLVVRVFNPHPEATSVAVATDGGAAHGAVVDLVDTATDAFDGRLVVPPGAIRTLRLA
jgi:alpha-mannosidase